MNHTVDGVVVVCVRRSRWCRPDDRREQEDEVLLRRQDPPEEAGADKEDEGHHGLADSPVEAEARHADKGDEEFSQPRSPAFQSIHGSCHSGPGSGGKKDSNSRWIGPAKSHFNIQHPGGRPGTVASGRYRCLVRAGLRVRDSPYPFR